MINKQFSERLNKELDNIGVPSKYEERIKAFAKIFHINPFKARTILEGNFNDTHLLKLIAQELEINLDLFNKSSDSAGEREKEKE